MDNDEGKTLKYQMVHISKIIEKSLKQMNVNEEEFIK